MTAFSLLFTLSCIGVAETIHLIGMRRAVEEKRAQGDDVHSHVLLSKYNALFLGIHNDIIGFMFYTASALLTALLFLQWGSVVWVYAFEVALVGAAVAMSLLFIVLMWKVIRYWCVWCLMSALLTFAMGIIIATSELLSLVL